MSYILLLYTSHIKTTAAQKEVALSYHRVRGLYSMAVFFCGNYILRIMYVRTTTIPLSTDLYIGILVYKYPVISKDNFLDLIIENYKFLF